MHLWRRWIFPSLMILVLAAIAVSLGRLAFFPADATAGEIRPTGGVSDPVVVVERGSVVNQLTLQGKVARDAEVVIRSTVEGTIAKVHAVGGGELDAGQAIATVKRENGSLVDLPAPEAGTLGELALVAGQSITLGAEVAKLSPARYHVLGSVEPAQLYRLVGAPAEGIATIAGGPAPFACTGLGTQVAEDGTTSVRCSIPGDQLVFPGLPVDLAITVGAAENVLVIPVTAVMGGSGSGRVWVDPGDGSDPVEQSVTLGMNDGMLVEVTGGLDEGSLVRQFVPGAAAPAEEFCYDIAPGEEICETGASW